MSQFAQPTAMPASATSDGGFLSSSHSQDWRSFSQKTTSTQQKPADIISPAEAKFWQEQAEKAPALIRAAVDHNLERVDSVASKWKIGSVALGSALGIFSFTKSSGKWKWLSGAASIASFAAGWFIGESLSVGRELKPLFLKYADSLEANPMLQQQLANHLSNTITAEMAASGIENAVLMQTMRFGEQMHHMSSVGQHYDVRHASGGFSQVLLAKSGSSPSAVASLWRDKSRG